MDEEVVNEFTPPTQEAIEYAVKSLADKNCQRCFGRGYEGVTLEGKPIACKCFLKNLAKRKK